MDGYLLARQFHQLKASIAMDLATTFLILHDAASRSVELSIKKYWSVTCPLCC